MKVFLSYSSKDEVLSNKLDDELMKYGANIFRDKRELEPLQNVTTFMQSISRMDYAIMLISINYLKSKPCVYEFTEYLKKQNAEKSIIPIITDGFTFSNEVRNEVLSHIYSETLAIKEKSTWFKRLFDNAKNSNEAAEDWKNRFIITWNFLANTKLFNFKHSETKGFSDILTFLQVYDADIKKSLDEIVKIKDIEEQDIAFDKLVNQHPGSYWVIRYRAYLCTVQKQYKKAIRYYEAFMSKFWNPLDIVTTLYDIGVCYYQLKNYEEAIKAHKKAIEIEPFSYLSYRGLGDVYMEQNKHDLAYDNYLYSISFQKHYLVLNNLGSIESERGNYSKAIQFFNEAIQLNEKDAISYLNICATYKQQKNMQAYEDNLAIAYKKFPNDYRVLTNYVIQHSDPEKNYDYPIDELISMLRKSFNINPAYIDTRMYLGQFLMLRYCKDVQSTELQFARDLLSKSLDMNPTKLQEKFVVANLKLLFRLLKDNYSFGLLEKKYS
ncbi:MAG: tetratricopeptide repeat protein [Ginsengibacter sp.]